MRVWNRKQTGFCGSNSTHTGKIFRRCERYMKTAKPGSPDLRPCVCVCACTQKQSETMCTGLSSVSAATVFERSVPEPDVAVQSVQGKARCRPLRRCRRSRRGVDDLPRRGREAGQDRAVGLRPPPQRHQLEVGLLSTVVGETVAFAKVVHRCGP